MNDKARKTRLVTLVAALVAVTYVAGACASSTTYPTTRPNPPSSTGGSASGGPPPVPTTGSYLGAWVNPDPGHSELSQLPAFTQAVGKVPAILSLYTSWTKPAPVSHMREIASVGAIPLVAWGCENTATVVSGHDDQLIAAYADALKAFGGPVLLRWFWEMDLDVPKDVDCRGSGGSAGFVAAWRHIYDIFKEQGASNVAFVWCPGIGRGVAQVTQYFPGTAYVDWIGVDGYDRAGQGQQAFGDVFGAWYSAFVGYDKPMMIGETAAMPDDQAAYIAGIGSSLPTQFPAVKALIYFDAHGPDGSWQLSPSGLQAWSQLSSTPYFSFRA